MADLEHRLEAPCRALHRFLDEELRSPDGQVFPDVNQERLWDAGVSDALDDEPHPDPPQALKRDGSHTVLHPGRLILADVGVRKSVCRAACRPMSGLHLRALYKSAAGPFAA